LLKGVHKRYTDGAFFSTTLNIVLMRVDVAGSQVFRGSGPFFANVTILKSLFSFRSRIGEEIINSVIRFRDDAIIRPINHRVTAFSFSDERVRLFRSPIRGDDVIPAYSRGRDDSLQQCRYGSCGFRA
jgi:hypothetical protein